MSMHFITTWFDDIDCFGSNCKHLFHICVNSMNFLVFGSQHRPLNKGF